jgi:hypothetical protein
LLLFIFLQSERRSPWCRFDFHAKIDDGFVAIIVNVSPTRSYFRCRCDRTFVVGVAIVFLLLSRSLFRSRRRRDRQRPAFALGFIFVIGIFAWWLPSPSRYFVARHSRGLVCCATKTYGTIHTRCGGSPGNCTIIEKRTCGEKKQTRNTVRTLCQRWSSSLSWLEIVIFVLAWAGVFLVGGFRLFR